MKIKVIYWLLLPIATYGQMAEGIRFEEDVSWEQVRDKAARENKYILVDCYATWCKPCKLMDKNVFTDAAVASYVNNNYISVKVQMDSTRKDNSGVQKMYPVAREFETSFNIVALPTYLFFSPEGRIVHKEMGSKTIAQFMELAQNAQDRSKQLYSIMEEWRSGQLDQAETRALSIYVKERVRDEKLAAEIADDYIKGYLNKLQEGDFLNKNNLEFIRLFSGIIGSRDKVFRYYKELGSAVDSIIERKGHAAGIINNIINKEIVQPGMLAAKVAKSEPQWQDMERMITNEFGKQFIGLALATEATWYKDSKQWEKYTATLIKFLETTDTAQGSSTFWNNKAWDIYLYSTKNSEWKIALKWVNRAIDRAERFQGGVGSAPLDTKACLLYELQNTAEAIKYEEMAMIKTAPQRKKHYIDRIERMKKGLKLDKF